MQKRFKKQFFFQNLTKRRKNYWQFKLNIPPRWAIGGRLDWKRPQLWFEFVKSLVGKYKLRLVLLLVVLVILANAFRSLFPKLPIFRNNLVIGVVGEYKLDNLPQSLAQLYSSGLTKFDKDGQTLPDLAKSWTTDDGKKFIFVLKDNLFWQDGKKLTAFDIKFQTPNVQVKVLDEKALEFTLADTFSPYPATLTRSVFRQKTQIGTGPYKIGKITKSGETLRQIQLVPVKNNLPEIILQFSPNSQTGTAAYKTGRVAILFNLMRLNGLENWQGAQIVKTLDSTRLVAVFYNTKDELLGNVKVRKALDLAIDRSKLPNSTVGPYPPSSWVNLEGKPIFDLKKAEKIITSEKIAGGEITIQTPSIFANLAQQIAANWQTLGFEVKIEKIDKIPQNFRVAIFGLEIPADPDQYNFWHSTQSQALTKIEDPKLDKLLEDGRKLIKLNERKAKYLELQKELTEIVPASFLFFPDRYIVVNKNSSKKLDQVKKIFPEFPLN